MDNIEKINQKIIQLENKLYLSTINKYKYIFDEIYIKNKIKELENKKNRILKLNSILNG